jgi:hypothetical protein
VGRHQYHNSSSVIFLARGLRLELNLKEPRWSAIQSVGWMDGGSLSDWWLLLCILYSSDRSDLWDSWKHILMRLLKYMHAPLRTRREWNTYAPWLTINKVPRDYLKRRQCIWRTIQRISIYVCQTSTLNVLVLKYHLKHEQECFITLACRPSVLNPSFSVFCFRRREIEFALAHRRLRVQRLSQNAIDSLGSMI